MTKNKTILIVEDEPQFQAILKTALDNQGLTTIQARNGHQALSLLPTKSVNLIVLDLLMPEMDGWEFINKLQETTYNKIPILILTNQPHAGYPADISTPIDFMTKTNHSIKEVVDKIKNLVHLK